MTNNIKSLYIHIPFCEHICSYCDFFKIVNSKEHEKYIQYLIKEIELKKNFLKDIETIYIGGGTPTCLSIELLKKLIDNLTKYISIDKIKEWTIEINPIHVNQDLISFLKQTPINRLSIGIQSYYDDILSIMKRKHNKTKAINCLKDLYNNGFTNISIDLIYGFLNDSKKRIKKEIKLSKKLHVKHISLYSLQLEEGTYLYKLYQKNEFKRLDEDKESSLYHCLQKYLKLNGYHQYEISNFSKKGYESKHNLTYWQNEHYLGIGAGASYYIDNKRYTNITNLPKYYQGIDNNNLSYNEEITLTIKDKIEEELMLGLRKTNGISINTFKNKYNKDIFKVFPNLEVLIKQKFIKRKNDLLYIPLKHLYIQNAILITLFKNVIC